MKKFLFLLIPVFMLSLAICSFSGCGEAKTVVPTPSRTAGKPPAPETQTLEIQKMK